jgi:hypothetical protein
MYDRNVEHPNRYQLVKVDGTDDIFDLIPAPGQVDNEGTFINKQTLLTDATAALFGLGADAVPDDVSRVLSGGVLFRDDKILDVLGNLIGIPSNQIVGGVQAESGNYTGTGSYGSSNRNRLTFDFSPQLVIVLNPIGYGAPPTVMVRGSDVAALDTESGSSSNILQVEWEANGVNWHTTVTGIDSAQIPRYQLNTSGRIYRYVAIG